MSWQEKRKRAVELYKGGMPVHSIVKILGCHKTTIYKWFSKDGVQVNDGARKYDNDTVDAIARMYPSMHRDEIAKRLGISVANVTYILHYYYITKDEEC